MRETPPVYPYTEFDRCLKEWPDSNSGEFKTDEDDKLKTFASVAVLGGTSEPYQYGSRNLKDVQTVRVSVWAADSAVATACGMALKKDIIEHDIGYYPTASDANVLRETGASGIVAIMPKTIVTELQKVEPKNIFEFSFTFQAEVRDNG